MSKRHPAFLCVSYVSLVAIVLSFVAFAQDERTDLETRKRERLKDGASDFWIYDDVERGFALAKSGGKPLLVSFRCVP